MSNTAHVRFSQDPEIRAQGSVYAVEAKTILKQQIDRISLEKYTNLHLGRDHMLWQWGCRN